MQSSSTFLIMIIKAKAMNKRFLTYLIVSIFMSNQVLAENLYYWTVMGNTYPLPIDSQKITIPHEAVAVDLRGVHSSNILYQLNTDEANANCLYYVDDEDVVEGLPSTNVVCNGIAEELFINDDGDFFCPIAFTAEFVMLRVTLRRDVPDSPTFAFPYYDTLMLPFDMDDAIAEDVNGIMPDGWLQAGVFVGDENDNLFFEEIEYTSIKANTPYLVVYQYGTYGSHVLFYGENKYIGVTKPICNEGNYYSFCGTTFSKSNDENYYQYYRTYNPYFSLVKADTTIEPFRCFVVSLGDDTLANSGTNRLNYQFRENGGGPDITGLTEHEDVRKTINPTIYSLSGQPLQQLQKGINVVKGKKIYIK